MPNVLPAADSAASLAAAGPGLSAHDGADPAAQPLPPSQSCDEWFPQLYLDLRRLARRQLGRRGRGNLTLGTATLLHETYLQLVRSGAGATFPTPGHFMAYAVRTMRSLIVDHARRRTRLRHGGQWQFVTLDTNAASEKAAETLLSIDEHLADLQHLAPALAQLVELKFFGGLTLGEIAGLRGCSERTAQRDWDKARNLLEAMMRGKVTVTAR